MPQSTTRNAAMGVSGQILATLLLLGGCAAVTPLAQQPFEDFQQAVSTVKENTDQALKQAAATELSQFKAAVAAGDNSKVPGLMLMFPPQRSFGWCYAADSSAAPDSESIDATIDATSATTAAPADDACRGSNKPTFAAMSEIQQTMAALNTQLLSYAGLLVGLSGADDTTQFDAAAEARKFDENAAGLLKQLDGVGLDTSAISPSNLALFSTIAANLADNYLENKRRESLANVLSAGLKPLDQFVAIAERAIDITAQSVKTQYQNEALAAVRAVIKAEGSARGSALDDFLAMNDRLQQQLALLESIANAYRALPNAQRQLISALNQNRGASLAELIVYADNIKQQYESLSSASGGG